MDLSQVSGEINVGVFKTSVVLSSELSREVTAVHAAGALYIYIYIYCSEFQVNRI